MAQPIIINDEEIFEYHQGGKLNATPKAKLETKRDLSIAYTPGVAQVSRAIAKDESLAKEYTWASRLVAVISDGSAVLGLGNIGPRASLPVMEGKSVLFKEFGDLNSIPIVINQSDVDQMVETIIQIAPSFGAINLEDIAAPKCFEVEERLIEALDIPVMHDDQHGTAVVVLAALINAAKVTGRELEDVKIVVSGAGAAGVAITKTLLTAGVKNIVVCDSKGIISASREDLHSSKQELVEVTNPNNLSGGIDVALVGADLFVGVSAAKVPEEYIATMAENSMVFAMANPDPEVDPEVAAKYAAVVATGRSDYPNQINNVLAFPGIFKGALDAGARRITPEMRVAAAHAIAELVGDDLATDRIVPNALDPRVAPAVAEAVAAASKVNA
ncbi:NAD(P)-dependent malic enzyme [Neomicrococcus lactis]|uniref:Malate dehydrogenase (Oxaloacetate-decarboxylating) n=1 Tax=Neomicrococcus lactis TaxID=732241 RepID=A0A7W8YD18_9MICC|nr:NADP-dependent malic enzyme [Neomicrococcus lactis]MBB5599127.1 malate dehydrogenase (oxaloacetate-decarboxylating) [Neomicrococcus lactis]